MRNLQDLVLIGCKITYCLVKLQTWFNWERERENVIYPPFFWQVEIKNGGVNTFSSIEKGEYNRLFDYVNQKKLRIKNRGKMVSSLKCYWETATPHLGWSISCSLLSKNVPFLHLFGGLSFLFMDLVCSWFPIPTLLLLVDHYLVLSCASSRMDMFSSFTHFYGLMVTSPPYIQ